MSFSIVVPAYNEEETIGDLINVILDESKGWKEEWELIIVDDGSTDRTNEIIMRSKGKFKGMLITHNVNKGLGKALDTGFKAATGDYIVTMDADLTHEPKMIPVLVNAARDNEAQLVIASRYAKGGGMKDVPGWRVIISKIANGVFNFFFGIKDASAGFKCYDKSIVKEMTVESRDFSCQIEIVLKLLHIRPRIKVVEVPYILSTRRKGQSKFKLSMFLNFKLLRWVL